MTRDDALDRLVREGVFMVDPLYAESVAHALDRTLAGVGIEPKPLVELAGTALGGAGHEGSARIKHAHRDDRGVGMWELAAKIALSYGLYKNIDHAMQSPFHKAASECRYIAQRSAIRLARLFGGQEGVDALRERNPFLDPKMLREQPYTGGQETLRAPDDRKIARPRLN